MKPLFFLLIALASFSAQADRQAMRAGMRAYAKGDYDSALTAWQNAHETYHYTAKYNEGVAAYQMHAFSEAEACFHEALRSDDLLLQASGYYNLGTLMLEQADTLIETNQLEEAKAPLEKAMEYYEQTLLLAPKSLDAKKNYERTFHDWVQLHIDFIDQFFLQGEDALRELHAKEAKEHYTRALIHADRLLEEPHTQRQKALSIKANISARLRELADAVREAEQDLQRALGCIHLSAYSQAEQIFSDTSTQRAYALDLRDDLKEKFESMRQKNQQIIQIENEYPPEEQK